MLIQTILGADLDLSTSYWPISVSLFQYNKQFDIKCPTPCQDILILSRYACPDITIMRVLDADRWGRGGRSNRS